MDKRFWLKAALTAALCIPPWGVFEGWSPQAKGQSEAWAIGNESADMLAPSSTIDIASLPAPGGPNAYNGASATRSQLVRTNESGQLLFFVIDGNVYDREGYLIADAKGQDCQECTEAGTMEMLAVPAPGQCGVFFLLSVRPHAGAPYNTGGLRLAILDLAGQNPHLPNDPSRQGHLLDL